MKEKIKRYSEKKWQTVEKHPTYKAFLQRRDKLAERIKNAILALFNAIGPVWNFLFLKTQDPGLKSKLIS